MPDPYCCVRALCMQAYIWIISTARTLPHRPATAGRFGPTAKRLRHGCGGCSIAHAVCRAVAAVGSKTCAINVTLLGLSLLISTSPASETIQDAVLVSLNWTGGITSADVKPSLARFTHIHMDGAYRSNSFFSEFMHRRAFSQIQTLH